MPVTFRELIQPAIDVLRGELAYAEERRLANVKTTALRKDRTERIEKLEELLSDSKIGGRARGVFEPGLVSLKAADVANDQELVESEDKAAELREKIGELEELLERHRGGSE